MIITKIYEEKMKKIKKALLILSGLGLSATTYGLMRKNQKLKLENEKLKGTEEALSKQLTKVVRELQKSNYYLGKHRQYE